MPDTPVALCPCLACEAETVAPEPPMPEPDTTVSVAVRAATRDDARTRAQAIADLVTAEFGQDTHLDVTITPAPAGPAETSARLRAETAEAALARVREVHQVSSERRPLDLSLTPITHCAHCNNDWPCPTITALEGPTEGMSNASYPRDGGQG